MSNRDIWIASDIIFDSKNTPTIDTTNVNLIVSALKAQGFTVNAYKIYADSHYDVLSDPNVPKDALIVDIYGGMDPGIIYEKGSDYYKKLLGDKRDCIVYIFSHDTMPLITGLSWLNRDLTDNYDNKDFTGIAHPDQYLETNGVSFIEDVTFKNDLNKIVAFIASQAAFITPLSEDNVKIGIGLINNYYKENGRPPKYVELESQWNFDVFTRMVMYYGLNYNFLQWGMPSVTTKPK